MPVSLPSRGGRTLPTAKAAPDAEKVLFMLSLAHLTLSLLLRAGRSLPALHPGVESAHLNAMPVSLPSRAGRTLPTALAAPVAEGMMLTLAPRPPRQSFFEGPSTVFCVAVVECTVVMSASLMPKESCSTCA